MGPSIITNAVEARLVDLQLEQDVGIRAEARGERYRPQHPVEPFAAGVFVRTSFTPVKNAVA
jgi:hypothetical protein